jgi:single-stranded-DNA-specific exonuclease
MDRKPHLLSSTTIDSHHTVNQIIKILLANRNIKDTDNFLFPPYPELSLDLSPAVSLINSTISNGGNILIYGDYDVDGITATAILWQALYKLTPKVFPFIPHRENDGYGIKAETVFKIQSQKNIIFDLIITVDNGIVAHKEISKIKSSQPNTKIIVTDHHLKDEATSPADAVVHTTLISGAGVSWFLAKQFDDNADLGLASLGAVADCLPLFGINRSIVVHGLQSLRLNPSPGIRKLVDISGASLQKLSTYELGFLLSPRINAAGRLADPTDALRLLCSHTPEQAIKYANCLNSYNQERQTVQKETLDKIIASTTPTGQMVFVSGDYNPGIIGLIAGKLTEKYYLPSIVISAKDDVAKGSCRSIPELNIIDVLRIHADLFIDLGGHSLAAGFSIVSSNIPKIRTLLKKTIQKILIDKKLEPHIDVDAIMDLSAVTQKNIESIQKLSPFGIGNPEPLFLFKNVTVDQIRAIGQSSDHLKLKLSGFDAIAFKKGELANQIRQGTQLDIIASLSINSWNNLTNPQLIVREIYPTS